jgi:hypothetical protein
MDEDIITHIPGEFDNKYHSKENISRYSQVSNIYFSREKNSIPIEDYDVPSVVCNLCKNNVLINQSIFVDETLTFYKFKDKHKLSRPLYNTYICFACLTHIDYE